MECFPLFSDGTSVPADGQFHVDPSDPNTSIRCLKLWTPTSVRTIIGGGSTARLGLLADGSVLKFPAVRGDKDMMKGLEIEDAILSFLGKHNRLVPYLGKIEDGIRFRRIQHGDVASFVPREPPSATTEKFGYQWSVQAAEAVAFIHEKGVIHCDIHPNNILVDQDYSLMLCDFAGSIHNGLDGGAMESTRYFLPRDPQSHPDEKSDIFALGSAMYFFMTGQEPYQTLSDDEVSVRYREGNFPDVSSIRIGKVILGCWTGQFQTAHEVLQKLT